MIPLIIFPDETIHVFDATEIYSNSAKSAAEIISARINRPLLPVEQGKIGYSGLVTTREFNLEATLHWWNTINPQGINVQNVAPSCQEIMRHFLRAL